MSKLFFAFGLTAALIGSPAISAQFDVTTLKEKKLGDHAYYRGMFYSSCALYKVGYLERGQFKEALEAFKRDWPVIRGNHYTMSWEQFLPNMRQLFSDEPKCLAVLDSML